MESLPKRSEKLSPEKIKAIKTALFGAFLHSIPTGHAEAADFPIGTDWLSGAVTMEYAMNNDPNEMAGLYVVGGGEVGKWHNPVGGDGDSVVVDFEENAVAIESHVLESDGSHFRVCVAHTHPSDNHEHYTYGPSTADFNLDRNFRRYVKSEVTDTFGDITVEIQGMVFERHGVWYYKVNDAVADEITEDIGTEGLTVGKFMNDFRDTLDNPEEYGNKFKWRLMATKLALSSKGIQARFVDYESLYSEPPCAGVDYKK